MARPGIPGLDVTEVSGSRAVVDPKRPNFTIPETPRDFSQGMRSPVTPNLPAVDNRPNFTMPRGPGPENLSTGARQPFDVEAAKPSRVQQGLRAVRQAGASVLDAVPGSLRTVGRVVGKVATKVGAPLAAADAVGDSFAPDATARYAKRFGVDEPTGDGSFGDIAKFAGLRTLGFASDLGNSLTAGLAGKALYRDMQSGVMPQPAAAQPNVPAAGPSPQDLRLAAGSQASPAGPTPASAPRENYGLRGVPTTETLGFDGYSRMLNNIRSLGPTSDAVNAGPAGFRIDMPKQGQWYEQLGLSRTDLLGLRPRDLRHLQSLATERGIATDRMGNERDIAGMRESGEMARANLSANTQRAISDRQIDMGLRGQDITREGHMINAQGTRARLMYDMNKDQRDYNASRADANFTQQSKARDDHNKWAESVFTTREGDKIVPDHQRIADFNNVAQNSIGSLITRLQSTGNPDDAKKAKMLSERGLAGLDDEDRALMQTLYDRRQRHMESRGKSPFAGSGGMSNDLMDYAIIGGDRGTVQDRYNLRGGGSIPVNDLRYREGPANAVLPDWFKTPTTALGPTARERDLLKNGVR